MIYLKKVWKKETFIFSKKHQKNDIEGETGAGKGIDMGEMEELAMFA